MGLITKMFGAKADSTPELSPAEAHLATLALAAGGVAAGNQLPAYINRVSAQMGMPAQ